MDKVIFLDIDGVLNRYAFLGAPSTINSIEPELAGRLNKILLFTGAKLIISSTWRHLILNGHYDIHGFGHMLRTHGITAANVAGTTADDAVNRGRQIRNWLRANIPWPNYVILDDDDEGMSYHEHRFIKIDAREGLQDRHVEKAIEILGTIPEPEEVKQ